MRKLLTAERGNPSEPLDVASSVPTRWRICITNDPAGPIQPRSGPSGGARESRSSLASFSARVGFAYRNPGLQAAVCNKTSAFQQCSLFSHRRKRLTHSERGNFLPPKQGSDSDGATQSHKPWFLFLVFSLSKRRGAPRPILYPRVLNKHLRKYNFRM